MVTTAYISDHCNSTEQCDKQIKQDVAALFEYGFGTSFSTYFHSHSTNITLHLDAWKLDGCGGEIDLVRSVRVHNSITRTWNITRNSRSNAHSNTNTKLVLALEHRYCSTNTSPRDRRKTVNRS